MKGVKMKKSIVLVVVLLLFAQQAPIVRADEISELKQQMHKMQQRLEQLEESQKDQKQKDDDLPDSLKWAKNINMY